MGNFRTSSLFHYTSLNSLKKVLEDGIKPNYCKEDFSTSSQQLIIGIPMISFCDIPLTRTYEFTSRYGNHAIGLSKKWAIHNGINPILYANTNEILSSLNFYKDHEKNLNMQRATNLRASINLMIKPPLAFIPEKEYVKPHSANLNLFGFTKKYMGENPKTKKPQCNYEENEWRYIVKEEAEISWKWSLDEYKKWRGDDSLPKPLPDIFLEQKKLVFSCADITHIIVQNENQIPNLIKKISALKAIGGTSMEISENEKNILFSKIISMEKIKTDF